MEESCEEGLYRKRDTPRLTCARVSVAESDAFLLEAFDAVVVERDALDVAREIGQGVLARADLLHVHGPALLPHSWIDVLIQAVTGEGGADLRVKDAREHVAGPEEARMRRLDPGRAVGGEPAGGDEEVGVRMILERARPGVEHRKDAGVAPIQVRSLARL